MTRLKASSVDAVDFFDVSDSERLFESRRRTRRIDRRDLHDHAAEADARRRPDVLSEVIADELEVVGELLDFLIGLIGASMDGAGRAVDVGKRDGGVVHLRDPNLDIAKDSYDLVHLRDLI